jgi:hypothetical protein
MNIWNIVESGVKHHNPSPTPGENIGHYMYANLSYKNVFAVLIFNGFEDASCMMPL